MTWSELWLQACSTNVWIFIKMSYVILYFNSYHPSILLKHKLLQVTITIVLFYILYRKYCPLSILIIYVSLQKKFTSWNLEEASQCYVSELTRSFRRASTELRHAGCALLIIRKDVSQESIVLNEILYILIILIIIKINLFSVCGELLWPFISAPSKPERWCFRHYVIYMLPPRCLNALKHIMGQIADECNAVWLVEEWRRQYKVIVWHKGSTRRFPKS